MGIAALRPPVVLGLILVLFFPVFFGSDSFEVMPKPEVAAVTSFLENARAGPLFCADTNAPLADTARYNLFPLKPIFGNYSLVGEAPVGTDIAGVIAANAQLDTNGLQPAYVMVTSSMIAYNEAYGVTAFQQLFNPAQRFGSLPCLEVVIDRAGTVIYERPPPSVHLYSEPWRFVELNEKETVPQLAKG